jgi:hypothetical protein
MAWQGGWRIAAACVRGAARHRKGRIKPDRRDDQAGNLPRFFTSSVSGESGRCPAGDGSQRLPGPTDQPQRGRAIA